MKFNSTVIIIQISVKIGLVQIPSFFFFLPLCVKATSHANPWTDKEYYLFSCSIRTIMHIFTRQCLQSSEEALDLHIPSKLQKCMIFMCEPLDCADKWKDRFKGCLEIRWEGGREWKAIKIIKTQILCLSFFHWISASLYSLPSD